MSFYLFFGPFLKRQLPDVWQADQLTVSLCLCLSKLIIQYVQIALISEGASDRVVFLIQIMRRLQVALHHALWCEALMALVFNEKQISGIDARHDGVVGLEAPADPEGVVGQPGCVAKGLGLD
jgi:hypothetical protein